MSGYTPLFGSIIASTIWREEMPTKIVWITMLAMADGRGVVEASIPGLADMAKVSLTECEQALAVLSAEDKYSRTKENGGRRIQECDGGWHVLNLAKFREKSRHRAEYMRQYRARNHNVTNVTGGNPPLPPVTESNSNSNINIKIQQHTSPAKPVGVEAYSVLFEAFWRTYPRKVDKRRAWKAWVKNKCEGLNGEIERALAWQVPQTDWTKEGGKFIPHPSTYLNNSRWEDEPSEPAQQGGRRGPNI